MSNRNKINTRRKVLRLSATFFALVILIAACKKDKTDVGSGLNDQNLNFQVTDTFTINTYSEFVDSMESDETSISLLGAYNDPVFGGVNCGIVTQIVPDNVTNTFPDVSEVVMDSVVLALRFSSINYYANIEDISVQVYEIDDVLKRDDQVYYTFDTPTIIGDNLIETDPMIISPDFVANQIVGTDTLGPQIRIRLKTEVGLDLIADGNAGLVNENFATNTFKGLYIRVDVPDGAPKFGLPTGKGTILYFALEDALSKMTMYYHTLSGAVDKFDFDINSTTARYNKIDFDRTGTAVEFADDNLTQGEQAFYLQGGGIRGVIELPYILDFYKDAEGNLARKIINKVVLVLPIQDFGFDPFDPTTRLFIARIVDSKLSTFTDDYGFGSSVSDNSVTYDEAAKEYRFTMTQEIQGLLKGDFENVGYRIYSPAFFASTIERIIFNGSKTSLKNKPRLEITYTEY